MLEKLAKQLIADEVLRELKPITWRATNPETVGEEGREALQTPEGTDAIPFRVMFMSEEHGPELAFLEFKDPAVYEKELQALLKVLKKLVATAETSDEVFRLEHLEDIFASLQGVDGFSRLNSPSIQVTKGHSGTTPYQHTKQVAQALTTALLPEDQNTLAKKIELRLVALYHDREKALFGNLSEPQVKQVMEEFGQKSHSHPDHAILSAALVQTLFLDEQVRSFLQNFPTIRLERILFLILNHHLLQDLEKTSLTPELVRELGILQPEEDEGISEELFCLLLTFIHADMTANPQYVELWQEKLEMAETIRSLARTEEN